MVLLLRTAVREQADVCRLIGSQTGAADKGQGPVASGPALLQQDTALAGELGKAEQHHQVAGTRLHQSLQKLRAAGGQQAHIDPKPAKPEMEQFGQGGGGVFAVDVDASGGTEGLHSPAEHFSVQQLGGLAQVFLLPLQPGGERKALRLLDGARHLGGRPGGLLQNQTFQRLIVLASRVPGETGHGGVGQLQALRQLPDGQE